MSALWHFWQAWHAFHSSGSGKVGQSFPSEVFASGFAAFARMAILHELWGGRMKKPFARRHVAAGLEISTMNELERNVDGVQAALFLLGFGERSGWWSHLFGTAQRYPDGRVDDDGDGEPDFPGEVAIKHRLDGRILPEEPTHLSLWDILGTFRADPGRGWPNDLELGAGTDGLLRYIDRAAALNDLEREHPGDAAQRARPARHQGAVRVAPEGREMTDRVLR